MEYLKKKTIWISISVIIIVMLVLAMFFLTKKRKITYQTLIATDGSFQIDFPTHISYETNTPENSSFVMDLYAQEEELFFYVTKIAKIREIDFSSVIHKDKENHLKDKENIHDDSGIVPFTLENYPAYEYHFFYTDPSYGKEFYCNVLWLETRDNFYVLNLEVASENKENVQDIFHHIKTSFIEL